jgi:hypothetical protein
VSGNVNTLAPDIFSAGTVNANFSAIGDSKGFTLTGSNNLAFGTDLKLGALTNNGGLTQTHALLPGSMAIGTGSNPALLATDQRGPGFARAVGIADIGAFEVQSTPSKVMLVTVNDGSAQRSRVTSLAVTFDQPPSLPGNPANAFQLLRQSDNVAVTLAASVLGNTVTLTFTGGPVELSSLADGRYSLTILASLIANLDGNGDGMIGDDFLLVGTPATGLYRLFGDSDGNGTVNSVDFGIFRSVFGTGSSIFDFNGDGQTNVADFAQFRVRFGTSI